MYRAFRYPLRPTATQEERLLSWIAHCRDLYNGALEERREAWRKQKKSIGHNAQTVELTQWRREDPAASAIPSWVQRCPLRRVDRAYQNYFHRYKEYSLAKAAAPKKPNIQPPGKPRYKGSNRYDSFTLPFEGASCKVDGSRVSLPKLPGIRFHQYRPLRGSILTVTVKRDRAGTWWVSFACDLGAAPAKVEPVTYVGIDVGLHTLATLSDPTAAPVENPKHGRRSAAQLARLQRTEKRRKRGSRSHRRAQIQVAKCYRRQANQRRDTAWKAAKSLVSQYDVVVHERLTIAKMVHGKLAKSIYDAGWGLLLRAIACKAEEAGKWCVAVDPRGTSQECSRCGATVAKGLSVRIHRCPWCGFVACRDANAAVNIEARGRRAVTDARACSLAEARRAA